MTTLLDSIKSPEDIKAFSMEQLEALVLELRGRIIETVTRNGGHLSSPLGVIELTVALHRVFDVPKDKLIWDVGHQCYAHKLLTGRADRFDSLRKKDGISGYPKMSESVYDCFGTGHSSTSISAAVGMAIARDRLGFSHHVVSLIGDGAMTGGMAFEALNHAGHLGLNMLVILNDNEMSISRNVGALARYFNRLITAKPYKRAKQDVGSYVKTLVGNRMTRAIQDIEKSVKGFITKGGLFQELGFNYIGPVDGHDLPLLIEVLSRVKEMQGPIFLHCTTEKGKGLKAAEEDPQAYHGVKALPAKGDAGEGDPVPAKVEPPPLRSATFTEAFAEALVAHGRKDSRIIAITAAMPTGTGLTCFEREFPDRFFDVGICEQHAVTLAAGLAAEGLKPVVAIYSTFLQRGYDQIVHDVCLQGLPVVFAIDRAGMVGEDSPTQNGAFDLSFLRATPNLRLLAPRDDIDTALMLEWALSLREPVALRYARDAATTIGSAAIRDVAHAETLREGDDLVFLTVGPCAAAALAAAERLACEGTAAAVVDARSVKPLDTAMLDALRHKPIITVEENALAGGFGSAALEYFEQSEQTPGPVLCRMGFDDVFYEHATRREQLAMCNLDADGLYDCAKHMLARLQETYTK
ncbi:MAG TPA: 1-deoxy-D-xylulose-5-phosphate synthase [Candidatus Hydrogenedentes bacterium]|nr:1-deoxy-D-xylulose-5-phosphate synthase [Candidatus Hydrogenedentota bacterium]